MNNFGKGVMTLTIDTKEDTNFRFSPFSQSAQKSRKKEKNYFELLSSEISDFILRFRKRILIGSALLKRDSTD